MNKMIVTLAILISPLFLMEFALAQDQKIYTNKGKGGDLLVVKVGDKKNEIKIYPAVAADKKTIKILKYGSQASYESLAIGDLFRVRVELSEPTGRKDILVSVLIGDDELAITANLISEDPIFYQTDLVEIIRGHNPSGWKMTKARFKNSEDMVSIKGMTIDAYMDYLEDIIIMATSSDDVMIIMLLGDKIVELALAENEPMITEHTGLTVKELASSSIMPNYFYAIGDYLLGKSGEYHNKKITPRLEKLASDLKRDNDQGPMVCMAMALLREALVSNGIQKLIELNKLKTGNGEIPENSFLTQSMNDSLEKIRNMEPDEIDQYLKMNGVKGIKPQRDKMRSDLIKFSKDKFNYKNLKEHYRNMEQAMLSVQQYDKYNIIGSDWIEDKKKRSLSWLADEAKKYDSYLSRNPMLRVIIEDDNGDDIPLWMALHGSTSDELSESYINQTIVKVEESTKELIKEMAAAEEVDDLIDLGSPKYSYLHKQLIDSSKAPRIKDLVEVAQHEYGTDKALWQKYQILIDKGMIALQLLSALYPPAEIAMAAIDISHEGGKAYLKHGEYEKTEALSDLGIAGTDELAQAHENMRKSMNDAIFSTLMSVGEAAHGYSDWKRTDDLKLRKTRATNIVEYKKNQRRVENIEAIEKYYSDIGDIEGNYALTNYFIGRKQVQIREIEDKIIKLKAEGKVGPLKKKESQLRKNKENLQNAFKIKKNIVKKMMALKKAGPKFPFLKTAKGRSSRYFMEQDFGLRPPTTEYWNFLVNRASKELVRVLAREGKRIKKEVVYSIKKGDGKNSYHVGPYEFQLQRKIVDGEGRPIMQPPKIEYKGKMIDNPNAGKESWFDRVIIDHDKKAIHVHEFRQESLYSNIGLSRGLKIHVQRFN